MIFGHPGVRRPQVELHTAFGQQWHRGVHVSFRHGFVEIQDNPGGRVDGLFGLECRNPKHQAQ